MTLTELLSDTISAKPDKPLAILETGVHNCLRTKALLSIAAKVAARPLSYLGFGPYSLPHTALDTDRIITATADRLFDRYNVQIFAGPTTERLEDCAGSLPALDIALIADSIKLGDLRDIWKVVHPALVGTAVFMSRAEMPSVPMFTKLIDKLRTTGRYQIDDLELGDFPDCTKAVAVSKKEGGNVESSGNHPDV